MITCTPSICRVRPLMSVNDDRYVGRAHARRTETRHGCRPAVSTTAAGGCKCAPFDDLRDTPRALHLANVMVRGPTDSTSPVAVFEGSILATVAVSAPHVMVKTAGAVLDGFGDLPEVDRRMLYETFRVWLDNDALVVGHPVQSTTEHAARRFSPCQPWAVGGRLDLGTVRLQRVEPNAIAVGVLNDDQPPRTASGLANAGCPVSYSGPPPHPALDLRENDHPTTTSTAPTWHWVGMRHRSSR